MNPELSIIIPVYNVEFYLRECLDSVKNQSFKNFECILVDDGSNDASSKICDEYALADSRFKVYHITNSGVSNARNLGIQYSSGDYITFIDSDDYVDIETYSKVIQRIHEDNCEVCCYGIRRVSNEQKIQNVEFKDIGLIKNFIYYDVYMNSVCNKVFKRSLIVNNNITFSTDLIVFEDMLFVFKALALSSKASYLDEVLYSYRTNEQSVCQSGYSVRMIQNYWDVAEYINDFCKEKGLEDKYRFLINYRKMYYAIQFLINPKFYSPKKFRENRGRHNIWIYTFRPDLFIMTVCSSVYIDIPARVFIELKKKKLRIG
ncbi:MAG: glycosyltransferase [Lachnospiraceae bacterium]|nr:glycosyltransferase [Lachnospiraceae bacterium]